MSRPATSARSSPSRRAPSSSRRSFPGISTSSRCRSRSAVSLGSSRPERGPYHRAAMPRMVQAVVAGDTGEAEELQELLRNAGIEEHIGAEGEDEPLTVLVPEDSLEAAKDAIEALTEPDDPPLAD